MEKVLVMMLFALLTACSRDNGEVTDKQDSRIEQGEEQQGEKVFENRYADCTVETCPKEMLIERYYEVRATKDDYFGESVDIQQVLVDLYGVSIEGLEEIEKVQEFIESDEELIEDDNPFFDVQGYIDHVVRCAGQCQSKFISYEEASSLVFNDALTLVRKNSDSYNVGSSPIGNDETTVSNDETMDSSSLEGTCKEVESIYTLKGLKVTSCSYTSSEKSISITVDNNSGYDLSYLRIEIYGIDSSGKTISSDYTNHGATIRNGASQTLQAYTEGCANSYQVEISEVSFK